MLGPAVSRGHGLLEEALAVSDDVLVVGAEGVVLVDWVGDDAAVVGDDDAVVDDEVVALGEPVGVGVGLEGELDS